MLWEMPNYNSAGLLVGWRRPVYPFLPPKGLQGGAALWRKLQLLCLGLEAKVGSAETSGWTIGKGDGGEGILAESRRILPDHSQPEKSTRA